IQDFVIFITSLFTELSTGCQACAAIRRVRPATAGCVVSGGSRRTRPGARRSLVPGGTGRDPVPARAPADDGTGCAPAPGCALRPGVVGLPLPKPPSPARR